MKKTLCNGTIPAYVDASGKIEKLMHKLEIKKMKRQKFLSLYLAKESPRLKVLKAHKINLTWITI